MKKKSDSKPIAGVGSLRAGKRGPLVVGDTDYHRRQSLLNREKIPERIVHAKGFGLYGEFELYKTMKKYTTADFLQKVGTKTPVYTRFSNFLGSRGCKDTAIDIRGFAVKFYTQEGNYDMLSYQFPAYIMADAIKFSDFLHAARPCPVTDTPQSSYAHEKFWDYVVNNQEAAHMVMWLMSLRGRPRSWRMMDGWPINTFILINEDGGATFVRFTWKARLGAHSLLINEANVIGGLDPDFHRHDIIEAVSKGAYPEYELGVQLIPQSDEFKYEFDLLDATKMWPEEVVPVETIGLLTLNRMVDNFFAEDEKSSFDPAELITGIAPTNDPVLQGRLFAYRDAVCHRLGTGNIHEIAVNKPLVDINTNLKDDYYLKQKIHTEGQEVYMTQEVPGDSFEDYFSQPRLFWNSLESFEKKDLVNAFIFHLQSVKNKSVREQNVRMWANVDYEMSCMLADNIGVPRPKNTKVDVSENSPSIMANTPHYAYTQKVAVLIGNGFDSNEVMHVLDFLNKNGVFTDIIGVKLGEIIGGDRTKISVDETFLTKNPVLYDSIYIVGGTDDNQDQLNRGIMTFYYEAYINYKPIGIATTGQCFKTSPNNNFEGVIFAINSMDFASEFLNAISQQRFWERV